MSDTPWTDGHACYRQLDAEDVRELERSHRRLLEALKITHNELCLLTGHKDDAVTNEVKRQAYCAIKQAIC